MSIKYNKKHKLKVSDFRYLPQFNISYLKPFAVYNIAVDYARDLLIGMHRGTLYCCVAAGRAGIYGWYNTVSKKFYIGSLNNLLNRPFEHLMPSNKDNVHFKRSLAKYGISNFYLVIIEDIGGTLNFYL